MQPFNHCPQQIDNTHDTWIIFDMNGTLTSDTKQRRKGAVHARPHCGSLCDLTAAGYKVGVWSSAMSHNVSVCLNTLQKRIAVERSGQNVYLSCIFCRNDTKPTPDRERYSHKTIKPLGEKFVDLRRVILVDDDPEKALPSEKSNLVHIPLWVGTYYDSKGNDRALQVFLQCLDMYNATHNLLLDS